MTNINKSTPTRGMTQATTGKYYTAVDGLSENENHKETPTIDKVGTFLEMLLFYKTK